VKTVHQSASKEVRAADVLNHYQRGRRVLHAEGADLRDFEGQLVAFPRAPHDDMVDAAGSALRYFLSRYAA
jgi:phage terminase large subunit-like protein